MIFYFWKPVTVLISNYGTEFIKQLLCVLPGESGIIQNTGTKKKTFTSKQGINFVTISGHFRLLVFGAYIWYIHVHS
jgi:hypothetical protein